MLAVDGGVLAVANLATAEARDRWMTVAWPRRVCSATSTKLVTTARVLPGMISRESYDKGVFNSLLQLLCKSPGLTNHNLWRRGQRERLLPGCREREGESNIKGSESWCASVGEGSST
ncbi:hypothetical protein GUJ93_ZPchr0009g253 [Zizania palustris]|uniref:Uncharacterized protein n=1 Tax=Zizania palustris TaxID=103762 RepID=A0A8J5VMX6_ZIZPA|nr:hypothetical protein GUJ93_ZPchr0009g253 [Zizania palustris]